MQRNIIVSICKNKIIRFECYWRIMDKWLSLKESKRTVADLLEEKNIYKIAVYGVGMLGRHLIQDLSGSNIKIVCAIDRNEIMEKYDFPVIGTDERIPEADALIVTPSYDFPGIKESMMGKGVDNIISLEALFG